MLKKIPEKNYNKRVKSLKNKLIFENKCAKFAKRRANRVLNVPRFLKSIRIFLVIVF